MRFNVNPDGSVPFVGTNFGARNASWFDPNMKMPYIMNWPGGLQRNFSSSWLFEVLYQGSRGVRLLNNWDINQIPLNVSTDPNVLRSIFAASQNFKPYPQFGSIQHYSNYGDNSDHGTTWRVEKRYSQGLVLNECFLRVFESAQQRKQRRGRERYRLLQPIPGEGPREL